MCGGNNTGGCFHPVKWSGVCVCIAGVSGCSGGSENEVNIDKRGIN